MSTNKNTILVQGGCGHAGMNFVKSLTQGLKGNDKFNIRVGYTEYHEKNVPQVKELGVECVKLDLNDVNTMNEALKGVDCVVINPPYLPNRETLCNRFIDKCTEVGVKHVFLISISGTPTKPFPWATHLNTIENKLMNSGMKYTIIRTSLYMETTLMQKEAIKNGSFFLPIPGDAKFPPVCVCDVGDLICKVALSNFTLGVNQTLEITGCENLSGTDIARIFSAKLGKPINFVSLNRDNFKQKLKSFGFQDYKVDSVTDFLDWYGKGNGRTTNDFSRVMEKEPRKFEEFLDKRKNELLV